MIHPKYKNQKVRGLVTKRWPAIGVNYVYRLDWIDGLSGHSYYYFGETYNPHQRLEQHKQNLVKNYNKGGCNAKRSSIKMNILKTYSGKGCWEKSVHTENKLIWAHHQNKKGWEWRYEDKKTDIPRMFNKWTLTHRGWIKKNKPKIYENFYKKA